MGLLKDIIRGAVIGVANAIPGVSGGTMMVSMGIYDDIIYCLTHLFKQLKKSILILLPYAVGMAIGIVGLAFVITSLYEHVPFQTSLLFIGLILGGVPILTGKLQGKKLGFRHGLVFFIFFVAIILLQIFGGRGGDVVLTTDAFSLLKLFLVGIIASATMVIPGVSGSMMLMTMGYYYPVIGSVKDFVSALAGRDFAAMLHICIPLIPFGIGVVLGIFAVAKLIEMLMERYEALTYCGILGLVLSSPVVILMGTALGDITAVTVLTGILALAAGVGIALALGKE